MGVLYLTNFTQKFRNTLEMNDCGKFVENLHKMTNFEKSLNLPKSTIIFLVGFSKKKNNNRIMQSKNSFSENFEKDTKKQG